MPAHQRVFDTIGFKISRTNDRRLQNILLDMWLEYRDLATEWDGDKWGFNPDKWMQREREQMGRMPFDGERMKW